MSKNINIINMGIKNIDNKKHILESRINTQGQNSFKQIISDYIGDVNRLQNEASEKVDKFAAGEVKNVHDVLTKVEEANLSFELMMEIRNKIVEGYREVIKTQV